MEKARIPSIPTHHKKQCINNLIDFYKNWRLLQKHAGKMTVKYKQNDELFTDKFENMFDIVHAYTWKLISID